jgi:hypothetical protein
MTESTMLRASAIGKLMDIQGLCNEAQQDPFGRFYRGGDLADAILDIIKAK